MIAFLVAMGLVLGQPSTRCHYTGVCAYEGQCDENPYTPSTGCYLASESSCNHSIECAAFGNCRWRVGKVACYADDPTMCAADKSPCVNYGVCKVAKSGNRQCVATREGCARSRKCQKFGSCGWVMDRDGGSCAATRKGCAESLDCKRWGRCAFDAKTRACMHDPKACPNTEDCRLEGGCTSNGGICAYLTHEDCQRAEVCTVYGQCHHRFQYCDPYGDPSLCAKYTCSARSAEDCAGSRICKAYGACTRVASPIEDYCSVHAAEASPCVAGAARVKEVIASSTYPDWAGYSFAASHLVDDKYWTAWAPDPSAAGSARLRFVFDKETAIVGLRLGNGFQRIDPTEGILMDAFGKVRGLVVRVDGTPYEVGRFAESAGLQELRFPAVLASEIEVEVFDLQPGDRFAVPAMSLLEPLTCAPGAPPAAP